MKKFITALPLMVAMLCISTGLRAQNFELITFPKMESRTDSLSYFMGMISGLDIADDIEAINPELTAQGMLYGYVNGYDELADTAVDRVSEYLSLIHGDDVAESRARMKTLPDTHPHWLRRYSSTYDPDGFSAALPEMLIEKGSEMDVDIPEMHTLEDSISFYRGIGEGRFLGEWLEEIEFRYAVHGMLHAFLLGRDAMDFDPISNYVSEQLIEHYPSSYSDYDYSPFQRGSAIDMPGGVEVPELATISDSTAYFFGVYIGGQISQEAGEFPIDLILKGFRSGYSLGKDIPENKIEKLLSYYFDSYQSELRMELALAAARPILDSLSALPGFSVTESGLIYRITAEGDNSKHVVGLYDDIRVDYRVTSLDGTREFSSYDNSSPRLGDMMEGFFEGIKKIGVGGTIEMYIPPTLTNDADGYKNDYGGKIFHATVTLLEVEQGDYLNSDLWDDDEDAVVVEIE